LEDMQIVKLYWDRDPAAITQTAEKYGRYCAAIANNILENPEDAKECVNDTYLQAWNAMPPHRPRLLSTFLGKITRNLSLNRCEKNRAEKRGGRETAAVLDELRECVAGTTDVEQEITYKELVDTINTFLKMLSPQKRSIFVCRYWYCDSISSIARQHRMKETAVSMLLHRLRAKLYQYLSERGFV